MIKIIINKDKLVHLLTVANEITSTKYGSPMLANVLLSVIDLNLTIRSTDLNIGFETTTILEEGADGSIIILCDKLISAIKTFKRGNIKIEQRSDSFVKISSEQQQNVEYTIYCAKEENFPEFPAFPKSDYNYLSQKNFKTLIKKSIFAVSHDESRVNLNGVFLKVDESMLSLVGTDGRRLSLVNSKENIIDNNEAVKKGVIIPVKTLTLIEKYSEIEGQIGIQIIDNKILYVHLMNYYFSSSLIDGEFPNYKRVIPEQQQYTVKIAREEMVNALQQVSLFSEKTRKVICTLSSNALMIDSDQAEIGKAKVKINCDYSGPDIKIALNFQFILDPLKAMHENNIIFGFTENSRAISIFPDASDSHIQEKHIIMPMQID